MLSEQNVQALGTALRNAGELTESLKNASRELQPAMAKIGPLVDSLGDASRQAGRAAREVGDLAQQARQSLARLNAPDGPLATATRSLSDIASAAARLDGETLPAITGMAQNIGQAARGATSTLRRVDSTPQSLLFGPAPAAPDPAKPDSPALGARPNEDAQRVSGLDAGFGRLRRGPRRHAAVRVRSGSRPAARLAAAGARAIALATSVPALSDSGIIWRVGDSAAPKSYATYRWASSPSDLVRQRLIERLSRQGPVMGERVNGQTPQLQVQLQQFEQVFAPDGASSQGRVVLQAVLVNGHKVLGQTRIAVQAPAPTQDAAGGVAALRQATDDAADQLAQWLATALPSAG